jgi:mono/diheme cytochrome c family protein
VPQAQAQQAQSGKKAATPQLSDQEKRGQGIFFQRCSLCHLTKIETPAPQPFKSFGPSLKGMVPKDADADQISFIRQFIMTGTDRMPGFQYGLKPNEIDDVIAFLKTL